MRALPLACAAVLAGGCVVRYRYQAAAPEQAIPGDRFSARAEVAGVQVAARAGDWRAWPESLEERLTPVGVTVENHSGKALRIHPGSFGLVDPGGFRHAALAPLELQREFASLGGWRWYGWGDPWLGFWGWPPYGPYPGTWGGWWYAEPVPPQQAEGVLRDGGHLATWIFFPVSTAALPSFELELSLVDDATGKPFGEVRIPFAREREPSPPAPPPAARRGPAAPGTGTR